MEQIIKCSLCTHLENSAVMTRNQHGFVKNKSCQANLISFFDQVTSLVDSGNAADITYLDFWPSPSTSSLGNCSACPSTGIHSLVFGTCQGRFSREAAGPVSSLKARLARRTRGWVGFSPYPEPQRRRSSPAWCPHGRPSLSTALGPDKGLPRRPHPARAPASIQGHLQVRACFLGVAP